MLKKRIRKWIIRAWMSEQFENNESQFDGSMEEWKHWRKTRTHVSFQFVLMSLYINGALWLCGRLPLGWRVRLVRLRISAHSPNREQHQSWFRYPRHFFFLFFFFSFTGNATGYFRSIIRNRSFEDENRADGKFLGIEYIFPRCRGHKSSDCSKCRFESFKNNFDSWIDAKLLFFFFVTISSPSSSSPSSMRRPQVCIKYASRRKVEGFKGWAKERKNYLLPILAVFIGATHATIR